MIVALVALALGAVDPCAPVPAPATSDPDTAALYRETGDAEAARGALDTAAVAYAAAAALDAGDSASRAALRRVCAATKPGPDPFQEGYRLMQAGDLRGAASAFERGRLAGDHAAALLEGVCRFRLGGDPEAEVALRDAEQSLEHRDLARYFLGLVALRRGESSRAAELLDAAATDPSLTALAAPAARLARRDGRLVVSVSLVSGLDSNVPLAPRSAAPSAGAGMMGGGSPTMMNGDGLYDLGGAALWRPLGAVGPYLRAAGALHRYFRQAGYDLGTVDAGGGWQRAGVDRGFLAELAYRNQRFGASPYLQEGRATLSGWLATGPMTWSGTYQAALDRYTSAFEPFSGTVQRLEGRAAWSFGPQRWIAATYAVALDSARASVASYLDQGPRLELRTALSSTWRAGLDAGVTWRRHGAFDASLGVRERRTFLDGAGFLEVDLANSWVARLSVEGREAASNVPAAEYEKLVPMLGLVYVIGM
jgi:tetratricopeptide (TPR) repeat protein